MALGIENKYKRVELSELTELAIEQAFNAGREIFSHEVLAQEAQRSIDRLVDFKASAYLQKKRGGKNVSARRVPSLALKLIVDLEEESKKNGSHISYLWAEKSGKRFKLDLAQEYSIKLLKKKKTYNALVEHIKESTIELATPLGLDTSRLLKIAYSQYDMMPDYALELAKALFDNGYINYYRTAERAFLGKTRSKIKEYLGEMGLGCLVDDHLPDNKNMTLYREPIRPIDISCDSVPTIEGYIGQDVNLIYQLIREYALVSVMLPARMALREARLSFPGDIESERPLVAIEKTIVDPQWTHFLNPTSNNGECLILGTEFQFLQHKGDTVEVKFDSIQNNRLSPSSLMSAMEAKGIVKSYTRLINALLEQKYIALEDGFCIPTPLGISVINLLEGFSFIQPDYTEQLEKAIDAISLGQDTYEDVVAKFDKLLDENLAEH